MNQQPSSTAVRAHAWKSPAMDRVVEDAIRGVGADVAALDLPALAGVVLCGGYGRGEGGVKIDPATGREGLSNDLDFYVVTTPDASRADAENIDRRLAEVGAAWSGRVGIDVDFSPAKTPWRLHHDQERLMVQELVRGYADVAGRPGSELFAGVERRDAATLPWTEAVRLLVNRGAGLLLAREVAERRERREGDFVPRNIAKCVLGAGDARLIARHGYRWAAADRDAALGETLYSRALAWKFRPVPEAPCTWEEAREAWLGALDEVRGAGRPRRGLGHAARWVVRRRSLGALRTFGFDPLVRILAGLEEAVRRGGGFPAELRKDWTIFQ